jgi:hypothetical protein
MDFTQFNFTEMELDKNNFYHFQIRLDTPYKWGDGYGNATQLEIKILKENYEAIFNFLKTKANWNIVKPKSDFESPSWINLDNNLEEIYAHPMELTGTLKYSTILELCEFIISSKFAQVKFDDLRIHRLVKDYSYKEALEIFNKNLLTGLEKIRRTHPYGLASNALLDEFGIYLKQHGFVSCPLNHKTEEIRTFLIAVVNDYLRTKN